MRRIDHDPDRDLLCVRFPYDGRLVEVVKGLRGRRWDKDARCWLVPARHAAEVCRVLLAHGFRPSEAVCALAGVEAEKETEGGRASAEEGLRVGALNSLVQGALQERFAGAVWVIGHLAGVQQGRRGDVLYAELVDMEGERQVAKVAATFWADALRHVERTLAQAGEGFVLEDGLLVRVLVRVALYAPGGRYHVEVQDLDPAYTLGKAALAREKVLQVLVAQDLATRNRDLPLPVPPLRVALVTSLDGEARRDFEHELAESGLAFAVDVIGVRVQGREAVRSLCQALEWVGRQGVERYDVVVVVRGGGSRTDLATFDALEVALAVARCPVKVVVGVGHQRDQSVLDLIALSAKTPTAAAALLVRVVREAWLEARGTWMAIREGALWLMERHGDALEADARRVSHLGRRQIQQGWQRVEGLGERLTTSSEQALTRVRLRLRLRAELIQERSQGRLRAARGETRWLGQRLRTAARGVLARSTGELANCKSRLAWSDPRRLLARGFALVRTEDGRLVRRAAERQAGERLQVVLGEGRLSVRVEAIGSADEDEESSSRRVDLSGGHGGDEGDLGGTGR